MIKTFRNRETHLLFLSGTPTRLPGDIIRRARRKLFALDAASTLNDLRIPPNNRLEALRGERLGQHSIRVNDQWRICFVWKNGEVFDVEVCDYH